MCLQGIEAARLRGVLVRRVPGTTAPGNASTLTSPNNNPQRSGANDAGSAAGAGSMSGMGLGNGAGHGGGGGGTLASVRPADMGIMDDVTRLLAQKENLVQQIRKLNEQASAGECWRIWMSPLGPATLVFASASVNVLYIAAHTK